MKISLLRNTTPFCTVAWYCHLEQCFPFFRLLVLLLADPFWLPKITKDPNILADVSREYPDDSYPE